MSYTNAPPTIDGLRDALLACDDWLALFLAGLTQTALATAAIHYPDADPDAALPLAQLQVEEGSFRISIAAEMTSGQIETLALALRHQLMSRYRVSPAGLVIASEPSVSLSGEATEWAKAAGDNAAGIIISGPYGLNL